MNRLNNLVVELAALKDLTLKRYEQVPFYHHRDGWVFISCEGDLAIEDRIRVALDSASEEDMVIEVAASEGQPQEAMRYLKEGNHQLVLWSEGQPRLRSLTVRSIPELIFCKFQYDPHIGEYGPYDWSFFQSNLASCVNTIVGSGDESHRALANAWRERGGRWIQEVYGQPYFEEGWTPSNVAEFWAQTPGMKQPELDGIIVDEFFGGDDQKYSPITESVSLMHDDPRLRDKLFYPYCGDMVGGKMSEAFIQRVLECGNPFAWERYLREEPTLDKAQAALEHQLKRPMLRWQDKFPEAASRMIVCLGYMTLTESLDVYPWVDYKVWMDRQFQFLANEPCFEGLYGLMEYTSGYADEETVRWAARLYRHYGLEGRRDLLSDQLGMSYELHHIQNPDFDEGLAGWTVAQAEEGSVMTKSLEGYSWLQGRYPKTPQGDRFLWLRRSPNHPNRVSQDIQGLVPGQTYSVTLISADYHEILSGRSEEKDHGLVVQIEGADLLKDKSFKGIVANNYSHGLGAFNKDNKAWLNVDRVVFKATGPIARLVLFDRATDAAPEGEIMVNFVQVQPYWMAASSSAHGDGV